MTDRKQVCRPFFTFFGGKWRTAMYYPAPKHDILIEPFAGSAGYALRYHDRKVILVEKDPLIAATWRYLLRVTPAEVLDLPDIQTGQTVDDLPVCEEARLLIGWWVNKGSATPHKSPSAWMRSGGSPCDFWGAPIRQRIASQVETIRHWKIIEGNYTQSPDIEATWFVDPPYQQSGRRYRLGSALIDYAHLSAWCRDLRGQVIVCEQSGATWLPFLPFRKTKANESRTGGKVSNEVVWLSDTSLAGQKADSQCHG